MISESMLIGDNSSKIETTKSDQCTASILIILNKNYSQNFFEIKQLPRVLK